MTPLLEQFLSESRDVLQSIGQKLMRLEETPDDADLVTELFRLVHTLKGNSGLFEFQEMTRVLHAGEDLMDGVRQGQIEFTRPLADGLLSAMDFVSTLCDEIEATGAIGASHATESARLSESLRQMIVSSAGSVPLALPDATPSPVGAGAGDELLPALTDLPEMVRLEAMRRGERGEMLRWIRYAPSEECFFQGADPLFQARGTPDLLWGRVAARQAWPALETLDAYRCVVDFHLLTGAPAETLLEYFRYMPDQVRMVPIPPDAWAKEIGITAEASPAESDLPANVEATLRTLVRAQREILELPKAGAWHRGRIQGVAATLAGCLRSTGDVTALAGLEEATAQALETRGSGPLLAWLDGAFPSDRVAPDRASPAGSIAAEAMPPASPARRSTDGEVKFGRRADDAVPGAKCLKVDQSKVDRMMNLIGEMVVSKNSLPFLAGRAENVFGVRELSREIKAQYTVINRIAEEMQDAIMQVRMMPVSFVFQRFPRLVRDTSRKLGKEINLVLEGEDTEADKNIIESLGDPLVHIVRNSLDHGFELPEARRAAGKPPAGTLTIRASQESDRVVIEIRDDGKGIDPAAIKRKAYEKGLIDETAVERLTDQEAVNLVFAPGFSTVEVVSDLSGRGVGMDVVRTAVEKVNGMVALQSEKGKGTSLRLSLPLSMAVTHVMIVESAGQLFGVPMESVVETVRVGRSAIRMIKQHLATVLRDRIVPLKSINALLGLSLPPRPNGDDEVAVLVVRQGEEAVGLLVDEFHETMAIILKPLTGVLAGLKAYSGSALMGDGSVLMVLNARELLA